MAQPVYNLEFNGPFPDWWNVVDDFGADPTGLSDSTAAFQAMFDVMCTNGGNIKAGIYRGFTGYVPSGTYNISNQLRLPDKAAGTVTGAGVNLWGQDPANTILRASGGYVGELLWSDGCHSSTIGRLTFDGAGTADIGVRLEHDPDIPTPNSYSRLQDCIFKDLNVGFKQTDYIPGVGTDSEFSILRCRFYRCSQYGVNVQAAEAYNYWVRQCYFEDCGTGIANGPSGAFNAYDNVFLRSANFDIYATTMRFCGVRRNQSFDSKRFLYVDWSNIIVESNKVSNPTETDAIQLENRVKVLIFNNQIKSTDGTTNGPVINEQVNMFDPSNPKIGPFAPLFIFYNQFTVPSPISITPLTPTSTDIQGNVLNPSLSLDMPDLIPQPPQVIRQTFLIDAEVEDPQTTVDNAATYALANPGSSPVVYLPTYFPFAKGTLSKTLVFPPNIAMSYQGGGNNAGLRWNPATRSTYSDPYVLFRGPSRVTVQNMTIGFPYGEGHKAGLIAVFDNCDQVNARVITDNCKGTHQFLDIANMRADVCDHVIDVLNPENMPLVVSCPAEAQGNSRVLHEGGAGGDDAGNEPIVSIERGGRYHLREFWYETVNTDKLWGSMRGMGRRPGKLTIETSLIEQHTSPERWAMKAIEATNWSGDILYLNDLIIGATKLTGIASRVNYLSWGGGAPLLSDSMEPASMYRQDGIPFWIGGVGTMDLTMESFANNSGWGVYGTKPADWAQSIWDAIGNAPTVWIDILGAGVTDAQLHRVRADIAFMSDTYVLVDAPEPEVTDFMSGVLPLDATYARTTPATMFESPAALTYGPENTQLYSQDLSNTGGWTPVSGGTGTNPVATANDATAPDGTTTATKLDFDTGAGTSTSDFSIVTTSWFSTFVFRCGYYFEFWYKGDPGTQFCYAFDDPSVPGNYTMLTCNGTWQYYAGTNNAYFGSSSLGLGFGLMQAAVGPINSTASVWIWGVQLDRHPAQTRPYLLTTGATSYGPRFAHDPSTSALLGIMQEPASTNYVASSTDPSGWTGTNCTVTGDGTLSPLAFVFAVQVIANAGAGDHYGGVTASTGVGAGANVGHSVFVKAGTTQYVVLYDDADSVPHAATFDFSSGSWVGTGTNVTLLPPVEMPDGWWRIGWISTMVNNVGAVNVAPAPVGTGTMSDINYTATGTESVYAFGLQFESADIGVTSFIPTSASAVTRAAESLLILRDDGVYDIDILRQNGTQTLTNQTIAGGSFAVPTSTSPVIRVVTRRKS